VFIGVSKSSLITTMAMALCACVCVCARARASARAPAIAIILLRRTRVTHVNESCCTQEKSCRT